MRNIILVGVLALMFLISGYSQLTTTIVEYDPEILEIFKHQEEIRVIVELKDKSNITVIGTKEERRELLRQKDKWFRSVIDEVFAGLSKDEFRIVSKTSVGLDGYISKKGFNKLIKDDRISAIYLNVIMHTTRSKE